MSERSPDRPSGARLRVLLIDDHALVRRGLMLLVEQQSDMSVCGEAGTSAEGLDAAKALRPDVAVVDVALGGTDGLALIEQIKAQCPEVRMLALSMHSEALFAERALRAGAGGYLMKEQAPGALITAIRGVAAGEVHLSDELKDRVLQRLIGGGVADERTAIETLSDRELTVFRLLGSGFTTRQVADQLHLSIKTVQSHEEHLKRKLAVPSASALVRYATLWMERERGG